MASLILRVEPVTSDDLIMDPPTMTMEAPAAIAPGAVFSDIPPAAATGMLTSLITFMRRSSESVPVICWSIPV